MPSAIAATQKAMSAAAGRSWYLAKCGNAQGMAHWTSVPSGRKRSLLPSCLSLLFPCRVHLRDLPCEGFGHRVLLARVVFKPNERKQTIRLAILRLAVGEAGQPSESSPVCRTRVGTVSRCQSLAAKMPRSLGKTDACLSHAWKLPLLVSTTAQGLKPLPKVSRATPRPDRRVR